jgi:hypothetical protein
MGARNRVGIGLSYWPARLHRLAEFIFLNLFLGSLKVKKFGLEVECPFVHLTSLQLSVSSPPSVVHIGAGSI